jgi:hypothetical protein
MRYLRQAGDDYCPDVKQEAAMNERVRYFGLDLAGYSNGCSGLAELSVGNGRYEAIIYRDHPFCQRVKGKGSLRDTVESERAALNTLTSMGLLLVDVPIDLGTLLASAEASFVWELTARPVDFAFGGLRPLADRIGAAVARFRNILHEQADAKVRETYPAASLLTSGLSVRKYKNEPVAWETDEWVGGPLAVLASGMRLVADHAMKLTSDDFDAVVCAYAGAAPTADLLAGVELAEVVHARIAEKLLAKDRTRLTKAEVPRNYQLFKAIPRVDIRIRERRWSDIETISTTEPLMLSREGPVRGACSSAVDSARSVSHMMK